MSKSVFEICDEYGPVHIFIILERNDLNRIEVLVLNVNNYLIFR